MLCPLAAMIAVTILSLICSARHAIPSPEGDGVVLTIFFEPPHGGPISITKLRNDHGC
jgi:hypothetical protein